MCWFLLQSFTSPMNQVQNRIWLMHWSLFIFFNHDNGRTQIIDLFNQDKYAYCTELSFPCLSSFVYRYFKLFISLASPYCTGCILHLSGSLFWLAFLGHSICNIDSPNLK